MGREEQRRRGVWNHSGLGQCCTRRGCCTRGCCTGRGAPPEEVHHRMRHTTERGAQPEEAHHRNSKDTYLIKWKRRSTGRGAPPEQQGYLSDQVEEALHRKRCTTGRGAQPEEGHHRKWRTTGRGAPPEEAHHRKSKDIYLIKWKRRSSGRGCCTRIVSNISNFSTEFQAVNENHYIGSLSQKKLN